MKKYNISNLPKGKKGAVDRDGSFYEFDDASNISVCHDKGFRYLTLEVLNRDPRILFEKMKDKIEHPLYYKVNYSDYDFKALSIDFLGICSFTIYGTELGTYAPIEVPDSKIAGFQITKEQQNTLIQLVKINHCSIDSLRPIFKKEEYNKSYVMIKR